MNKFWVSASANDVDFIGAVVLDEADPSKLCVGADHPVYFILHRTAVLVADYFRERGWETEVHEQLLY
jgi:hypothetical protein